MDWKQGIINHSYWDYNKISYKYRDQHSQFFAESHCILMNRCMTRFLHENLISMYKVHSIENEKNIVYFHIGKFCLGF